MMFGVLAPLLPHLIVSAIHFECCGPNETCT